MSNLSFHPENASNVLRPHYGNLKTQQSPVILDCVPGKLGLGNQIIIVTASFWKSYFFKMFFVHTKTKSRRFQILPV